MTERRQKGTAIHAHGQGKGGGAGRTQHQHRRSKSKSTSGVAGAVASSLSETGTAAADGDSAGTHKLPKEHSSAVATAKATHTRGVATRIADARGNRGTGVGDSVELTKQTPFRLHRSAGNDEQLHVCGCAGAVGKAGGTPVYTAKTLRSLSAWVCCGSNNQGGKGSAAELLMHHMRSSSPADRASRRAANTQHEAHKHQPPKG
eukprot:COSAG02_NODE_12029_length_1610_cov_1.456651_1_plen_204_part_00